MTKLHPHSGRFWLRFWAELCLRLRFASLRLARNVGESKGAPRNLFVNASPSAATWEPPARQRDG